MSIRDNGGKTAQMNAYNSADENNALADKLEAENLEEDQDEISYLRACTSRFLEVADLLEKWPFFMGALVMKELGVYHLVDMSMLDYLKDREE